MSSYFDAMAREILEADESRPGNEEFLAAVIAVEERLWREVTRVTGDREFPNDLREKVLGEFARHAVYQPEGVPMPWKAREFVLSLRCSRVLEHVHELFHDVARRRITTRFGRLSDSPTQILALREEYDQERSS